MEDANARLEEDIQELQFLYEEALNQLEAARSEVEAQVGDISLQQGEVEQLRAELEATQESLARITAQSTRAQREHDRTASDLKWQIDDLRTRLADQESKVRVAFVEREMSSATTADVQSRLTAYLGEIDRLKLAETKLLSEVEELRAASSGETLRVVELEKRIRELEEDKMLMDISLDNKETEITLLNRQASRSGSVTPTRKRLVASTSRIPSTPSASTIARPGETPGPNRRLSVSMHGSAIKRPVSAAGAVKSGRRESSIMSTPKPTFNAPSLARRPSLATPTPAGRILSATTKHNHTSDLKLAGPRKSAAAEPAGQVKRKTSLPTLARPASVSRTGHRALVGMEEEDEVEAS
jgi:hypothetical protein